MSSGAIFILVVENHLVHREALCLAIEAEPDLQARAETCDCSQALPAASRTRPNLILFSLGRNDARGLAQAAALRRALPQTPILALTYADAPGQVEAALQTGASAVLSKGCSRAELIQALRRILSPSHSTSGGPP